jgi:hypothetical protein
VGVLALASGVAAIDGSAARGAAGRPQHDLYEWHPNGEGNGPMLMLEDKLDLTGRFDVQCQKTWIYVGFGSVFALNTTTGELSGSVEFPQASIGVGSSYRGAEVNWYDFKSGGPLHATLAGTATPAAATGTLTLKLYSVARARRHRKRRAKPRRTLSASCAISFDAPNVYAPEGEAPPSEAPPAATGE